MNLRFAYPCGEPAQCNCWSKLDPTCARAVAVSYYTPITRWRRDLTELLFHILILAIRHFPNNYIIRIKAINEIARFFLPTKATTEKLGRKEQSNQNHTDKKSGFITQFTSYRGGIKVMVRPKIVLVKQICFSSDIKLQVFL